MLFEAIGWLGATILLAAFACVSFGSVTGRSRLYQTLNILGGLLLAINSGWHQAWPSALVNIVWTGIAAGALVMTRSGARASTGV